MSHKPAKFHGRATADARHHPSTLTKQIFNITNSNKDGTTPKKSQKPQQKLKPLMQLKIEIGESDEEGESEEAIQFVEEKLKMLYKTT